MGSAFELIKSVAGMSVRVTRLLDVKAVMPNTKLWMSLGSSPIDPTVNETSTTLPGRTVKLEGEADQRVRFAPPDSEELSNETRACISSSLRLTINEAPVALLGFSAVNTR